MNRKAQVTIGMLVMAFVAIIVGISLFNSAADNIAQTSTTTSVTNETQITTLTNGTVYNFTGFRSVSSFSAFNETNGTAGNTGPTIGTGNYSISNNQIGSDGNLVAQLTFTASNDVGSVSGAVWNVSYTGFPTTYDDTSGRNFHPIILILFALGIAVIALIPVMKSKVLDNM